ncbi:MAG TPA: DUF4395 domain-containing protein [Candidatus Micrarchaeia archaeon]|nr:DUF4395 domain-containing protein [Candidatus Micrarchaeia archaeon]
MARVWMQFPNPVNEVAARVVAGGVAVVAVLAIALDQPWLSAVLAYGFLARVAAGPTLSPLGQLATRVVAPRLSPRPRLVAGPPKRFAQAIGAVLTVAATVAFFGFGATTVTEVLLGVLVAAATLESALGLCLGCRIFAVLMRWGWVPAEVCAACADLGGPAAQARRAAATPVGGGR